MSERKPKAWPARYAPAADETFNYLKNQVIGTDKTFFSGGNVLGTKQIIMSLLRQIIDGCEPSKPSSCTGKSPCSPFHDDRAKCEDYPPGEEPKICNWRPNAKIIRCVRKPGMDLEEPTVSKFPDGLRATIVEFIELNKDMLGSMLNDTRIPAPEREEPPRPPPVTTHQFVSPLRNVPASSRTSGPALLPSRPQPRPRFLASKESDEEEIIPPPLPAKPAPRLPKPSQSPPSSLPPRLVRPPYGLVPPRLPSRPSRVTPIGVGETESGESTVTDFDLPSFPLSTPGYTDIESASRQAIQAQEAAERTRHASHAKIAGITRKQWQEYDRTQKQRRQRQEKEKEEKRRLEKEATKRRLKQEQERLARELAGSESEETRELRAQIERLEAAKAAKRAAVAAKKATVQAASAAAAAAVETPSQPTEVSTVSELQSPIPSPPENKSDVTSVPEGSTNQPTAKQEPSGDENTENKENKSENESGSDSDSDSDNPEEP